MVRLRNKQGSADIRDRSLFTLALGDIGLAAGSALRSSVRHLPCPHSIIPGAVLLVLLAASPTLSQNTTATKPAVDPSLVAQKLIYFPPHRFTGVREIRGRGCVVWTNDGRVDADATSRHMDDVVAYLSALPLTARGTISRPAGGAAPLPATAPASSPASVPAERTIGVALYATQGQFKSLWTRVGTYYDGHFYGLGQAGGYSYRVFCATWMDPDSPALPRELSHELAHVWAWQRAGLPNDGNWLSEGLAMAVEAHFFPGVANRAGWAQRLDSGRYLPLKRLMATRPLDADHYWQACTLVEVLLARYREALPAVIQAATDGRRDNDLVNNVLRSDWPTLEKEWAASVRAAASQPASAPAR